ncbi:stomatin-like isoform X5 [Anolis carolinensis]|uniref:stomatin-like isoform X5 n=1 Tax=Anolis carolinensis TaxID=28377 RepID=UPI002F2B7CD8
MVMIAKREVLWERRTKSPFKAWLVFGSDTLARPCTTCTKPREVGSEPATGRVGLGAAFVPRPHPDFPRFCLDVSAGVYFILPCIDILIRVDTRTRFLHLSIKEVLTKDPLSLDITGAVYYRIQDPLLLLRNVTDPDEATVLLMQTTLGDVLGTKYLSQIICNREKISENIQSMVDDTISSWGIKLEYLEIRNVKTRVKSEHPVAKSGGSPASSGGSTPPPCPELKEKEGQVEPPQTVKESSEMPTTLDSVQKETTGDVVHESPNPCAENPLQNGKELKEGPSPPD